MNHDIRDWELSCLAGPLARGLCLLLALLMPASALAEWKVKQFKVFGGAPYSLKGGIAEDLGYDWFEAEDLSLFQDFDPKEIETAFNMAAKWFSDNGFPEPLLEPIVDTPQGKAYRVYVCSEAMWLSLQAHALVQEAGSFFREQDSPEAKRGAIPNWSDCGIELAKNKINTESHWAGYSGRCAQSAGARTVFFLNTDSPAFSGGRLSPWGFQTVVHELFHAIYANTETGKSPHPCAHGKWIVEGMADAVAFDVAEKLWPKLHYGTEDEDLIKLYGLRPLSQNIATYSADKGYQASSFWRFLAGLNGGYNYLSGKDSDSAGLLEYELSNAGDWKSEASWADGGIHAWFNIRLNEMLIQFFNDISFRVPTFSWATGPAEQHLPRYLKTLLGPCESVTLTDTQPGATFWLELDAFAGGCAWLTLAIQQSMALVSVQTETNDVQVFKDVWVGLPLGNTMASDATQVGVAPNRPGNYIGAWLNFPVAANRPMLMTFANLADDPEDTVKRRVLVDVSIPASTSSLRSNTPAGTGQLAPPAQTPSNARHTQRLAKKRQATQKMVAAQKELDKQAVTPYSADSNKVVSRPELPGCTTPFLYQACGPSTAIYIELAPGTYLSLGGVSGAGGTAAQGFGALFGQATANPFDANQVMEAFVKKVKAIDAGRVVIAAPLFDYGFTGTIDNALIETRVQGRDMASRGPPDSAQRQRIIGRLSIEEYTPLRVRGRYTAPLSYTELGPDGRGRYVQGPTISGTFSSVAPWMEDRRFARVETQTQEEMADDIGSVLGVSPATMRSLREQGKIPGGSPSAGGGGGSATTVGGKAGKCLCTCAYKYTVDELCELLCEEEFAACPD